MQSIGCDVWRRLLFCRNKTSSPQEFIIYVIIPNLDMNDEMKRAKQKVLIRALPYEDADPDLEDGVLSRGVQNII